MIIKSWHGLKHKARDKQQLNYQIGFVMKLSLHKNDDKDNYIKINNKFFFVIICILYICKTVSFKCIMTFYENYHNLYEDNYYLKLNTKVYLK